MSLALIDYGAGNLQSVRNALKAAGASEIAVTADPEIVRRADRIVLPGVGAFAHCMAALSAIDGMVAALNERVIQHGQPFLGICVGMQLMADAGEEHGRHMRDFKRKITPNDPALKVPHMGWNDVLPMGSHPLIAPGEAYFLHSYAFEGDDVLAQTQHGGPIVAAIGRDNFAGVQFHPEKSQRFGLDLLSRFLEWRP